MMMRMYVFSRFSAFWLGSKCSICSYQLDDDDDDDDADDDDDDDDDDDSLISLFIREA